MVSFHWKWFSFAELINVCHFIKEQSSYREQKRKRKRNNINRKTVRKNKILQEYKKIRQYSRHWSNEQRWPQTEFDLNLLSFWRQKQVRCSELEICSVVEYQTIAIAETARWLPNIHSLTPPYYNFISLGRSSVLTLKRNYTSTLSDMREYVASFCQMKYNKVIKCNM